MLCTGQIQSGQVWMELSPNHSDPSMEVSVVCIARNVLQIDGVHSLYCRYTISYGNDWTIVHVGGYIGEHLAPVGMLLIASPVSMQSRASMLASRRLREEVTGMIMA